MTHAHPSRPVPRSSRLPRLLPTLLAAALVASCGSATGTHGGGGIAPRTTLEYGRLPYLDHVPQTQSRWCWAAASATIINSAQGTDYSACEIASQALGRNCCASPGSCNVTNSVYAFPHILRPHGFGSGVLEGTVPFDRMKREIDAGRPVLIRVESPFGEGHFVVLVGYDIARVDATGEILRHVLVSDPMYGYYRNRQDFGYAVRWKELLAGRLQDYRANWTHTLLAGSR